MTDKRIIHKRGLISRHTQEMNITKVETVDVFQTFWGRIFGYGMVMAKGTGASLESFAAHGVATAITQRDPGRVAEIPADAGSMK